MGQIYVAELPAQVPLAMVHILWLQQSPGTAQPEGTTREETKLQWLESG
jgi:hypothetical protein